MATQKDKSKRLDSSKVIEWAKKHKRFSTNQVAATFGVRPMQAAAAIAIMRIKEVVERGKEAAENDEDRSSRWIFIG